MMTKAELTQQALELPVAEQLELAPALWDNASPPDDFTVTSEIRAWLDERLEDARRNPGDHYSVEETDEAMKRTIATAR